jgi:hypothetical protein
VCVCSVDCHLVLFICNKVNEEVMKNLHNFKMETRSSFIFYNTGIVGKPGAVRVVTI